MAIYTFDGSMQGWSGDSFAWTGGDGFPSAGCIVKTGAFATTLVSITGLSIAVGASDTLQFYSKYTGSLAVGTGILELIAKNGGGTQLNTVCRIVGGFDAGQGVWQLAQATGFFTDTVASLELVVSGVNTLTEVYFDSVYVVDVPPSTGYGFTHSPAGIPGAILVA